MASYKAMALYDVEANQWTRLEDGAFNRRGTQLVNLGGRIFLIGGEEAEAVEEFNFEANTWTSMEADLIEPRLNHGLVSVPAKLFSSRPGGCQGIKPI